MVDSREVKKRERADFEIRTSQSVKEQSVKCQVTDPAAVVVSLLRLERTRRRTRIGLLVDVDADVEVVADVLLVLVVAPVLLGCIRRPASALARASAKGASNVKLDK